LALEEMRVRISGLTRHMPSDTHLADFAWRNVLHAGNAEYLSSFPR